MDRRKFLQGAFGVAVSMAIPAGAISKVFPQEPNTVNIVVTRVLSEDVVYSAIVDCDGLPISDVYEWTKEEVRRGYI